MTQNQLYTHCHRCGTAYEAFDWPRNCGNCRLMIWRPIHPVSVLLQPVQGPLATDPMGIIVGRRCIEPQKGVFALPGGFKEFGETAEDAARRELMEEMNITAHDRLAFFSEFSDDEGKFLVFFLAHPLPIEEVNNAYRDTSECDEMLIAYEPMDLAFQSHTAALKCFFTDHAYVRYLLSY